MSTSPHLLLALLLCAAPVHASAVQGAIAAATVKAAIEQYAPILILHKEEKYLPTCVESYLKITTPFQYEDRNDHKTWTGRRFISDNPYNPKDMAGDIKNAKAYVNVKVGPETTDLQFWFLYAYNGPGIAYIKTLGLTGRYRALGDFELGTLGVHEGDWEHIMVRIDNKTGKALPKGLYMAAHNDGAWYDMPDSMVRIGDAVRLLVYASKNGHATFLHEDREYHVTVKAGLVEFRLVNDCTSPGQKVDYRGRCEIFGIQGDPALVKELNYKDPDWERFTGRWGRVVNKESPSPKIPGIKQGADYFLKLVGALDEMTFEAGPYPPPHKPEWTEPEDD
jgi:hypothetical protein